MSLRNEILAQTSDRRAIELLVDDFERRREILTIVQVGACNGSIANDPLHEVIKGRQYVRAHLVEAVEWLYADLAHQMAPYAPLIRCHHLAIAARDETRSFFFVAEEFSIDHPDAKDWLKYQIGSLTDRYLKLHVPGRYVVSVEMDCMSPGSFFGHVDLRPGELDLLITDTEGFDAEIVRAFLQICRPRMLIYEQSVLSNPEAEAMLETIAGYGYEYTFVPYNVVAYLGEERRVDFDAESLAKLDETTEHLSPRRRPIPPGDDVRLTLVAAGRNDDYAEGFMHRYQCFLYQLSEQLAGYEGNFEILVVEWNPPPGEPRLSEMADFVKPSANRTIRFIEVPPAVHQGLPNADRMPFFEYIAKNAGIRRARGEFVLATNSDVLFSEELLDHLCRAELRDDGVYRADRYDFDGRVSIQNSVVENLRIARETIGHGHVFRPRMGTRDEIVVGEHIYGASGDFFLAHRSVWSRLHGYREFTTSGHIDSILCLEALDKGFKQYVLPSRMKVFHQAHGMFRQHRPQTPLQDWRVRCEEDDRRADRRGWGLSSLDLPERVLNAPRKVGPRWETPVVSFQGREPKNA